MSHKNHILLIFNLKYDSEHLFITDIFTIFALDEEKSNISLWILLSCQVLSHPATEYSKEGNNNYL